MTDIINPSEIPDDEQAVQQILADARKQLAELKELTAPLESFRQSALKDAEEHQRKVEECKRKAREFENQMFDAKRAMRKIEELSAAAERKAARIAAMKAFAEQAENLYKEFDLITAGAPWREWAKDHQIDGAKRLAGAKRAILADAPRLGKTLTSLAACDMNQSKKILIVAPNTVVREFEKQVRKWAPHRKKVFNLTNLPKADRRARLELLEMMKEFVVLVNYEAWWRDKALLDFFVDVQFDTVIIDEAHNMANKKGNTFLGMEKVIYAENVGDKPQKCEFCGEAVIRRPRNEAADLGDQQGWGLSWQDSAGNEGCILAENWPHRHDASPCSVKFVYPVTGTIILNKPQDLWPSLHLIDRKAFPDLHDFERDYLVRNSYTKKWEFKYGGLDRLTKKLADKYVRRDRNTPGIQLPAPEIVERVLTLDPSTHPLQYEVCRQINQAIIEIAEDKVIGIDYAIVLIMRKRQAITWPCFDLKDDEGDLIHHFEVEESVKIDEVIRFENSDRNEWVGMIPELVESGEKVVLFSQFKAPLREIARRLEEAGIRVGTIDGDTPVAKRAEIQESFNDEPCGSGGFDVVLGNYKAMGTGITLKGANQMIILDEEWNPAKNEQAYDRIVDMEKMGVDMQVTILRVENTIDVWMQAINEQKKNMVDGFNTSIDIAAKLIEDIKNGGLL
jgi:SNF2 family DNA or RNA helicase